MNHSNTSTTPEQRRLKITEFQEHKKNTLRGYFSALLPSGLIIHRLGFHAKADGSARWISPPSREWKDNQGETHYDPIIEFATPKDRDRFRDSCLAALDEFLKGEAQK